nr:acylphosphatase [uncultured Pedobacter sp.]
MKAIQITISGRVQGVFFRVSTKAVADQLGMKGFVKNQKDGTVLIHAEGDPLFMQDFIDWCKLGPDDAHVENATIEDVEVKNYRNFEVLKK